MGKIKFDEFVRLNRGFDLPEDQIIDGEYPVVASTNIKAYHNAYKVNPPVVVTGRSGSLGKVQYINEKCWPLNTSLYSKDFRGNNPKYIYYYLQIMHLEQYNAGSGVPTLNQNHLQRLKIRVHELEEQQKIADILSAYDNLIENNNKRIKLLEQMAENLYKEWFVRFRFPGHEGFDYKKSVLGDIPENFEVVKMGTLLDYYIGGGWGSDDESEEFSEEAYVVRGTDFPRVKTGNLSTCPLRYHKPSNYSKRKFEAEDIAFEVSGGTAEQPVGRSIIISQRQLDRFDNKLICASFCKLIRCDKEKIEPLYLYYWLQYMYDTRMIEKFQLQSTGIINFKFEYFLRKGDVLLPPRWLMDRFVNQARKINEEIDLISEENDLLIKQRDLLLPRLMSGKLEVKL